MKAIPILVLVLAFLPFDVTAQTWTGPGWGLRWSPNPPQELVEGYRVYIDKQDPAELSTYDAGSRTAVPLVELGLTSGRYDAWVTAYNPVGESEPSNTVPFVYVADEPGGGGELTAPGGLELYRASQ